MVLTHLMNKIVFKLIILFWKQGKLIILSLLDKTELLMGWDKRVSGRSYLLRYLIPLLTVPLALWTKTLFFPVISENNAPFLTFFGAVVFSAWYGGFGPGLLATVLSAMIGDYFFLLPVHTIFWTNSLEHHILVGIFFVEGILISLLSEAFHYSLRKSDTINDQLRKLSNVVEQTGDGVVITDSNGFIQYINPSFEQITGYSLKEAVGKTPGILKSGKHNKTFYKKMWDAILSGQPFRSRMNNHKKNGGQYFADLTITPLKNYQGMVTHFVGTWKDITDNIRIEEALRQSEKQYRLLFEKNPHPMWVIDDKTNIFLAVNDAAVSHYGYSREEFLKMTIFDLHLTKNIPSLIKFIKNDVRAVINTELGSAGVWPHRKKDGSIIDVEVRRNKIHFKNKIAKLVLAVDVTERISQERRKDEFISIAGHELRTPITSLKAFTQIIYERGEKMKKMELADYLVKMDGQLSKVTRLIGELLDVSKMQSGGLDLLKSEHEFRKLLEETVNDLRGTSKQHKILTTGNLGGTVLVDRYRINQVLINLILNAMKYSPKADKVVVNVSKRKDDILVGIQDFGIGINKEDHSKIFEKFYRSNGPEGERFPGLGLGLYIASEIVKSHGGKIWVESKRGEGSQFFFTLPLAKRTTL